MSQFYKREIETSMITGYWMGWFEIPEGEGNYSLEVEIEGEMILGKATPITSFSFEQRIDDAFSVPEKDDNGKKRNNFIVSLVIFFIAVVAAVFILYVLRTGSKIKDQPDSGGPPAPSSEDEMKEE